MPRECRVCFGGGAGTLLGRNQSERNQIALSLLSLLLTLGGTAGWAFLNSQPIPTSKSQE